MSWQPEIDELHHRRQLACRMGGEDKVKKHKDAGKLTVRERIEAIADDGSFHDCCSTLTLPYQSQVACVSSARPCGPSPKGAPRVPSLSSALSGRIKLPEIDDWGQQA